jgi:hypothetical protein
MPRRICAMSGKGSVFGYADIFVGGNGSGFGFGARIRKQPARKSAREAARNGGAGRSGGRNGTTAQVAGRARSRLFEIGLRLVNFRLSNGRRRCGRGLATILGERFAWEKNRLLGRCAGGRRFCRTMIEAALRGATRFETTRLTAAIFLATIVAAAVVVASVFVPPRLIAARLASLWRSVLGGREIASADSRSLRASAAMTSAATAVAAAASAITATVWAAVTASISATAVILAAAIAATV